MLSDTITFYQLDELVYFLRYFYNTLSTNKLIKNKGIHRTQNSSGINCSTMLWTNKLISNVTFKDQSLSDSNEIDFTFYITLSRWSIRTIGDVVCA